MPTGKKNTTIEWENGGKTGNKNKLILRESVNLYSLFILFCDDYW